MVVRNTEMTVDGKEALVLTIPQHSAMAHYRFLGTALPPMLDQTCQQPALTRIHVVRSLLLSTVI